MRELIDPYWWTVALTSLVQFVLFLRRLYRRIRSDEMTRTFVEDMATSHLPHIYRLLEKLLAQNRREISQRAPHGTSIGCFSYTEPLCRGKIT